MPAIDDISLHVPPRIPKLLRDLIHDHTGMFFEAGRFDMVIEKLRDRVEIQRCRSYLDYYYLLKDKEQGPTEWLRVIDAFSVQETFFWRQAEQIQALVDHVVPAWFKRHRDSLQIWCAACCTGEEPTSIAIALHEGGWGGYPITIHASDASEAALARARSGIYRERSFRSLPPALRAKYFDPPDGAHTRLRRELLLPIIYERANLVVAAEIDRLARAPVIFCRNVFIYFSPEAIRGTLASFAQCMPPKGHLFVGASEPLHKLTNAFDLEQIGEAFVYCRNQHFPS